MFIYYFNQSQYRTETRKIVMNFEAPAWLFQEMLKSGWIHVDTA